MIINFIPRDKGQLDAITRVWVQKGDKSLLPNKQLLNWSIVATLPQVPTV